MAGNQNHGAIIKLAGIVSATAAGLATLIATSRSPSLHWLFIGLICVLVVLFAIEILALAFAISDWVRDQASPLRTWVDWARELIDRVRYMRPRVVGPHREEDIANLLRDRYREIDWRAAPSAGSPVPMPANMYETNGHPVAYNYEDDMVGPPIPAGPPGGWTDIEYGHQDYTSASFSPVIDGAIRDFGSILHDAVLSPIAGIIVFAASLAKAAETLSGRSASNPPFDQYEPVPQDEDW
jgi:hypothetical protein